MMPPAGSDPQGDAARLDAEYIVRQLGEMSPELKQRFTEDFASAFWSALRGYALPDAKNFVNMRFLHNGSEVTQTSGGTTVGLTGGKGQFDIVNFVNGTADIDSATNARQLNVHVGGGGADCMFDFLVSTCFTSLAGWVEGTTFTSLSGCTFKGYSTVQGVMTYLDANSVNGTHTIFLCGTTSETVTLTYPSGKWLRLYFYGTGPQRCGFSTLTLNGTESSSHDVQFYDLKITTVQAAGTTGAYHPRFYRCTIGTMTTAASGALSAFQGALLERCDITDITTAANPLSQWDNFQVVDCNISGSIDLSAFNSISGQNMTFRGNLFSGTASALKLVCPKGVQIINNRWRSNSLKSTVVQLLIAGATATLGIKVEGNTFNGQDTSTIPAAVINITNTDYTECVITSNNFGYGGSAASGSPFILTSATAKVCATVVGNNFQARNNTPTYIETDGGVSISGKFINSSFGLNTPDSFNLTLLTGSSNNLYIGTGTITGAGASSATSIPLHNFLSSSHSDTLTGTVVRGDVVVGNSTPKWSRLAIGTANKVLHSDGTDATWQSLVAADLPANQKIRAIEYVIDGGGSAITTGVKGYIEVPFGATITQATLLADQSGSIVVNIWKCTYAQFDAGSTHPVVGDKITASAPPTISAATKAQDSTLTGWTTAITAGDILAFNVDSASTVTRATLSLKVNAT